MCIYTLLYELSVSNYIDLTLTSLKYVSSWLIHWINRTGSKDTFVNQTTLATLCVQTAKAIDTFNPCIIQVFLSKHIQIRQQEPVLDSSP